MKMEDLVDRDVRVYRTSIKAVNEYGKTAGVVTGLETFYTIKEHPRQLLVFAEMLKRVGVSRDELNLERLFKKDGQWYFLANASHEAWVESYRHSDPRDAERYKAHIEAAARMGAVIVRAADVDDRRE